MDNQTAIIWISIVGILILGFVLRFFQQIRKKTGNKKFIEWSNDHIYAYDDDEL